MTKSKIGKIDISKLDSPPEDLEFAAAKYMAKLGYDIDFVRQNRTKGSKNADVDILGIIWEVKSLIGVSKRSIGDRLSKGSKQSVNIILDTRHYQQSEKYVIGEVEKQFDIRRKIKKIILITKSGKKLDFDR